MGTYSYGNGYDIWWLKAKVEKDAIWELNQGNITEEEFNTLKKMISSPDEADLRLADALLEGILTLKEQSNNNTTQTNASGSPANLQPA